MIYYTDYYKPQPKTSLVRELLETGAEGVKPDPLYIYRSDEPTLGSVPVGIVAYLASVLPILFRDLPQSSWLSSPESAFPARRWESESFAIDIEMLMGELARKVRLENPHRIREYLLRFPELLDVIPRAVNAAKRHFPEAQIVMEVYQDPEIADRYLVLYIRLKHYDDSVINRLQKAESEYLDQLVNRAGWIQLTTDFREPGEEDAL